MKHSRELTADLAREWLTYDRETGMFLWAKSPSEKSPVGSRADGPRTNGYRGISIFGRNYVAHRVAWLHAFGVWPRAHLDHVNRVRDDNRLKNLREATQQQNMANTSARAPGLKGTTWHNGSWRAQISHHRKTYHLGSYRTQEEAHAAYCLGAKYFHGVFANTESLTGPIEAPPPQSAFEAALREVRRTKMLPTLAKSVDLPEDLKRALIEMQENFQRMEQK